MVDVMLIPYSYVTHNVATQWITLNNTDEKIYKTIDGTYYCMY